MTKNRQATAPPSTLLRVKGVTKAFGPTIALRGCSLELRAGEVHALMGENGSGKSTLVKILSGVHKPDGGQVLYRPGGRPPGRVLQFWPSLVSNFLTDVQNWSIRPPDVRADGPDRKDRDLIRPVRPDQGGGDVSYLPEEADMSALPEETVSPGGNRLFRAGAPRDAMSAGICTVFQEVQCVPGQTVLDNLWLGTDGMLRRARGGAGGRRERARAVLTELLGDCPDALLTVPAGSLSLSERQAVAVGRALLRAPAVLILDEATSALDVATRDRLLAAARRLTVAGGAVLFISHRMDEVTEIADRVTVLRSGESVATLDRAEATPDRLVALMTGGEHLVQPEARADPVVANTVPAMANTGRGTEGPGPVMPEAGEAARVILTASGLTLRAGEIVGLAGLEGQGQDEYLRALRNAGKHGAGKQGAGKHGAGGNGAGGNGADTPDGTPVRIAYVARDRREESIFPPLSVRENFTAATLSKDARGGLISARRASARFAAYSGRLKIRLGRDRDAITTLSGGNQQKVVIARVLASDPQVLLLNDPTRGVDIGAKRDIYALLRELAASGMAIVMLSTEVDEHLELMDRVLVFRDGAPAAELDRDGPGTGLSRTRIVAEFFGPAGGLSSTPAADSALQTARALQAARAGRALQAAPAGLRASRAAGRAVTVPGSCPRRSRLPC